MKSNKQDYIPFTEVEEKIALKLLEGRNKVALRFPLLFGLAATFGLVATIYGFNALISKVTWLVENPWAVLLLGVFTLLATGTAYKKLN